MRWGLLPLWAAFLCVVACSLRAEGKERLMRKLTSSCSATSARSCIRLRRWGEPCVYHRNRNPVTWRRFGCMDESINLQNLFTTSDCEDKSRRQCIRLARFGVACKYFGQRDPQTNQLYGCKEETFDPARRFSVQDCYAATSSRECVNLARIGVPCAYYSRRNPLTQERYGCMEEGMCHLPNRQRRKCLNNDRCMFLRKGNVVGRRNYYGCVSKEFCDFKLEMECNGFQHCSWNAATQQCGLLTTGAPSVSPTKRPSQSPTLHPTSSPTISPTKQPSRTPTQVPTNFPSKSPTTGFPSVSPTQNPTGAPTPPTMFPTQNPTNTPTTGSPSTSPTWSPSKSPSRSPTRFPSGAPTRAPTKLPTKYPTQTPTTSPTRNPTTAAPSRSPTRSPISFTDDFGKKPNLFVVFYDDIGHADIGFGEDPRVEGDDISPEMTRLAREGLILNRHYAHWHCSPSRRSLLSGRLPIHTGEDLSNEFDDHMDERWTWISEKLKPAGYYNLFLGKGHIGFRYWSSMPINRGFDEHLGMLGGYSDYRARNRWRDDARYTSDNSYSTLLIGEQMEQAILSHFAQPNASPMFAYLAYQAPHSPIQCPGNAEKYRYYASGWWPSNCMFRMIWALDVEVGIMERTLKQVGQWDNSLIVVTGDNGGSRRHLDQIGNNYPFRGEKSTSFEGGIRVPTFLTGGFLPDSLRGRSSELVSHVADWYATFCHLAGVDADDGPPSPPRHEGVTWDQVGDLFRPSLKTSGENVWGSNSYPNIDAVNIWPLLRQEAYEPVAKDAAHDVLIVSGEVAIAGDYKLVTGQPCEIRVTHTGPCIDRIMYNWVDKSDSWSNRPQVSVPVAQRADRCLQVIDYREMATSGQVLQPCLFDLGADLRETRNLVEDTATIEHLWRRLNNSMVYQYNTRVPGLEAGLSESSKQSCSYTFDISRINTNYEPVCN